MANRRALKRTINLICEALFADCIAASLYGNNRENAQALLYSIIKTEIDFTSRISHPEPGMPAKQYFRQLRSDFSSRVSEIFDQIHNNN